MSARREQEGAGGGTSPPAASEEQRYFLDIERHFLALRGAPMMLSPSDWRIARGWHQEEIPLSVIRRVLDRLFEQRRERGAKGRVSGLRYFDDAVRSAWSEILELRGPEGPRAPATSVDVGARLAALAERLPAELPGRDGWRSRILELGEIHRGEASRVEQALAALDRELLQAARDGLGQEEAAALRRAVEPALETLRGRLDREGLEATRAQLLDRRMRERLRLPELSLFAD